MAVLNTPLRLAQNRTGLDFGEKNSIYVFSVYRHTGVKYFIEVHSKLIQSSKMGFFAIIVPGGKLYSQKTSS